MFQTLYLDAGLPHGTEDLCQKFANFYEDRFAAPTRSPRRNGPNGGKSYGAHHRLTWASFNVRSIYGRGETITELMVQHQISALALQETFERANDPPEGLPRSVSDQRTVSPARTPEGAS
jgi:hypothetical protein